MQPVDTPLQPGRLISVAGDTGQYIKGPERAKMLLLTLICFYEQDLNSHIRQLSGYPHEPGDHDSAALRSLPRCTEEVVLEDMSKLILLCAN